MQTLIDSLKCFRAPSDFEKNKRIKNLIKRIFNELTVGDAHAFWLWRSALIAETHSLFPDIITPQVEGETKSAINNKIENIYGKFNDGKWRVDEPSKKSLTPNRICDEVYTSWMLSNLIKLCESRWLSFDNQVEIMIQDAIGFLISRFNGICFDSKTIYKNGKTETVQDPYVNSIILKTISLANRVNCLKNSVAQYQLESFFNKHLYEFLPEDKINELLEISTNPPQESENEVFYKELKEDGDKFKKELEISIRPPLLPLISKIIGIDCKLKYSAPLSKNTLPTFNNWYEKIKLILKE